MEEITVRNIVIGKQFEDSKNYQKLLNIIRKDKIEVNIVEAGQKINIEKDLYFDVLWPSSKDTIINNSLNNNSLVCKLYYKNFSMLFTGDIEKVAEQEILKKYKNNLDILKATILKVAHHGSKTSTIYEFLEVVKPKACIVGVGKNNLFGHPSMEVIERLNLFNCNIFRTDENAEIDIICNGLQFKVIKKKQS